MLSFRQYIKKNLEKNPQLNTIEPEIKTALRVVLQTEKDLNILFSIGKVIYHPDFQEPQKVYDFVITEFPEINESSLLKKRLWKMIKIALYWVSKE